MKYFAYGSNMLAARLLARLPDVRLLNTAWIDGYRLCFHKRGDDGSGKCDAWRSDVSSDRIYGVVFEMTEREQAILNEIEGEGYQPISVALKGVFPTDAFTYIVRSQWIEPGLPPFKWYRDFVLAGAVENKLPGDYISSIKNVPFKIDPDAKRSAENRAVLLRSGIELREKREKM